MGILDEAIREHLELKRQHGAGDPELKQLEDEAFGPPERPAAEAQVGDVLAEAPTEFMTAPETAEAPAASEETPLQRREPTSSIGDLQEAPPEPADEEQPAAEHEAVIEPEPSSDASDEERQAIAEQPTEHFDVEEELGASATRGPSDEELIEEEIAEPRLAPVDPLADAELEQDDETKAGEDEAEPEEEDEDEAEPEEDEDDFFDEQRLSDELDQALEAPLGGDDSHAAEAEPTEEADEDDEDEDEDDREPERDSDVLEKTPDFLEDTPEDDELWFEQKPPKDFDFDD